MPVLNMAEIAAAARWRRQSEARENHALNDLVREPPATSVAPGLFGLIGAAAPEPERPAPPPRCSYQDELDAAQIDARVDRMEMLNRIASKRQQLASQASDRLPHMPQMARTR